MKLAEQGVDPNNTRAAADFSNNTRAAAGCLPSLAFSGEKRGLSGSGLAEPRIHGARVRARPGSSRIGATAWASSCLLLEGADGPLCSRLLHDGAYLLEPSPPAQRAVPGVSGRRNPSTAAPCVSRGEAEA